MTRRRWISLIVSIVVLGLVVLLWDELQDFGAEIYRFFN